MAMIFLHKEIPVVLVLKTIVRSVLRYGCKTWKLTKTEAKKLDAFQSWSIQELLF